MAVWAKLQLEEIYLGGPSASPHWHIPRALHSLYGEIEAADMLIRAWEPLLDQRLADNGEQATELGIATSAIVVTSLITERAIKTLIAQTKPHEPVPHSHELSTLFREDLDTTAQDAVQRRLETLPRLWDDYAGTSTTASVLEISNKNFVDWRYAMEPKEVTGGMPKPLLTVAVAATLVGIDRLSEWQATNGITAPKS